MALNAQSIADRVIRQLDGIGIRSKVGGRESETATMIKIIIREIVFALQAEAQIHTIVKTTGSPTVHTGTGNGKIT